MENTGDWITDAPLRSLGFDASRDGRTPLCQFVETLESLRCNKGSHALWNIGSDFDLNSLGSVGNKVHSATRLGDALKLLAYGFDQIQSGAAVELSIYSDQTCLTYGLQDGRIWPRAGDAELTLGLFAGILARYGVETDDLLSISVEHGSDRRIFRLQEELACPIRTDTSRNGLVFRTSALDKHLQTPDKRAPAVYAKRNEDLQKLQSLPQKVRQHIYQSISVDGGEQSRIANMIGLSERTLRRKLAEDGVSYRDLLDDCRHAMAVNLLRRKDLSLVDIGLLLGYADQAVFSRAAQRWFGTSPARYRDQFLKNS
ncbi:MAG: helix-turn-helix domain-containing protein [Pseudomonadota bacterium]